MVNANHDAGLSQYILSLLDKGQPRAEIEAELLSRGHDERFIKDLVQETVKLRYAKRRSQGLVLILIGAIICFASFLLTITSSSIGGNFSFVLYGLTSVGIIFVFSGFMMVF